MAESLLMKMFSQSPESVITPYCVHYDGNVYSYTSGYVGTINLTRSAISCIVAYGFANCSSRNADVYQFITMKEIARGSYLDDSIYVIDGKTFTVRITLSSDGSTITIENTSSNSMNNTRSHLYFSIY